MCVRIHTQCLNRCVEIVIEREMPIGEITPPEPLDETTDVVLAKESSEQNIDKIKQEKPGISAEGHEEQDQFGLVDIPPLPDTPRPLPDATVNILVELSGVSNNDPTYGCNHYCAYNRCRR